MLTSSKPDVALSPDSNESPIEAMRQIMFAVNLLEDIRQDVAVNLGVAVPKMSTIFEMIPNVSLITNYIRRARYSS